jgi:hypothetical protein
MAAANSQNAMADIHQNLIDFFCSSEQRRMDGEMKLII